MKKSFLLSILTLLSFWLIAQEADSSKVTDINNSFTNIEGFNTIEVTAINLEVLLEQGESHKISINNDSNKISYKVEDSVLTVLAEGNSEKTAITITFLKLNKIKADQIVTIKSINKIKTDRLLIDINGTSKVNLSIDVYELETNIDGSCKLLLNGKSSIHTLKIQGASEIDAEKLITQKTVVDISGAGKATVNVKEEISGQITGAAELIFIGDPALNNIDVTGVAVFRGKGESIAKNGLDTLNVKIGKYKLKIVEDEEEAKKEEETKIKRLKYKPWGGIDIGLLGYLDNNYEVNMPSGYGYLELNPAKSISVGLNIYEQNFRIIKDYLKFGTGIGFQINTFSFANNTRLLNDPEKLSGLIDTMTNFSKTKLRVSYVTLPLLLEINTSLNEKRAFHLSGGLILGYHIGSRSKLIYMENNLKTKEKVSGNYHINPFKYSVTARVGFGKNYSLFAIYDLNPLFAKNKGPELYSYSFGLSFLFD